MKPRLGVLFLVVGPAIVASAKGRSLRHDQSLHGVGLSSRRELRLMGKAGLEDRITSLKEEVGQLELDLDKGSKDNAASIDKLQKELNATADQFPDQLPLRTEDEQKLKAKINKIEDQINDTHQKSSHMVMCLKGLVVSWKSSPRKRRAANAKAPAIPRKSPSCRPKAVSQDIFLMNRSQPW